MAARLGDECASLDEVRAHLVAAADPAWLLKERVAEDLFAYLVVERALLPDGWVKELAEWAAPHGWAVSLQGRKIYAVPQPLTKSAAVREVARRTGAEQILAAGDSSSTPTCCTPRTAAGGPATANSPTAAGARRTSRCWRRRASRRARRSCGGCSARSARWRRCRRPDRGGAGEVVFRRPRRPVGQRRRTPVPRLRRRTPMNATTPSTAATSTTVE